MSFFKKGTIHIVFTDLDALYRFNMYAGRNLRWLPPTYGAKHYGDMDEEERTAIDEFEGAESYERMMERVDEYMRQERLGLPMPGAEEVAEPEAEDDAPFAEDEDGQMLLFA